MRAVLALLLVVCVLVISVSASSNKRCEDLSDDCVKKAKDGWCSKNQSYAAMGRKCQRACKMCNKKAKTFDIDSRCRRWKELGYCDADPHSLYMFRSCKFSCPKLVKAFTEPED